MTGGEAGGLVGVFGEVVQTGVCAPRDEGVWCDIVGDEAEYFALGIGDGGALAAVAKERSDALSAIYAIVGTDAAGSALLSCEGGLLGVECKPFSKVKLPLGDRIVLVSPSFAPYLVVLVDEWDVRSDMREAFDVLS